MHVCMSHSKLQNQLVSEGVKFLIKTYQNLMFNSFFWRFVRGDTVGDLDIQNSSACDAFSKPLCLWGFSKTPLPVRLFQNTSACQAFSKPLCLSGFFKTTLPACMYVCQACMAVCQACMYVWENPAPETRSDSLRKPFSI